MRNHRKSNFLPVLMLIFVVSPLASLFRLFMMIKEVYFEDEISFMSNNTTDLFALVSNSSVFDELLKRVLLPQMKNHHNLMDTVVALHNHISSTQIFIGNEAEMKLINSSLKMVLIQNDMKIILPFIAGLTIVVVITLFVVIANRENITEYPAERNRKPKKLKKMRLLACLDQNIEIITKANLDQNFNKSHLDERKKLNCNMCPICLSDYQINDVIVHSSECRHTYHHDCMREWIVKRCDVKCPCCRKDYIDMNLYKQMKREKRIKVQ